MIKAFLAFVSRPLVQSTFQDIRRRHYRDGLSHAAHLEADIDFNLEQHLRAIDVVGYSTVAALTFLLYDIMTTFDDEVRLIWPNPWGITKFIFFFIRYFPVMLQISIMFIGTPPFTFTEYECYIWNVYQSIATLLVVACVDYILILRVFALYPRNMKVRYLLHFTYVAEIVIIAVTVGIAVPQMEYDDMCTVVNVPLTFLIAAGAPIAFQTLLFVLTGWKFVHAVKSGWGNIPIMKLLMRDGTWAFILLFIILVSEAMLYGLATEAYSGVLYGWLNTAFSFCGYRILLNLNKLNHSRSNRPSCQTPTITITDADIQFSTHFEYTGAGTERTNEYAMGTLSSGEHGSSSQSQFPSTDEASKGGSGRRRSRSIHQRPRSFVV